MELAALNFSGVDFIFGAFVNFHWSFNLLQNLAQRTAAVFSDLNGTNSLGVCRSGPFCPVTGYFAIVINFTSISKDLANNIGVNETLGLIYQRHAL